MDGGAGAPAAAPLLLTITTHRVSGCSALRVSRLNPDGAAALGAPTALAVGASAELSLPPAEAAGAVVLLEAAEEGMRMALPLRAMGTLWRTGSWRGWTPLASAAEFAAAVDMASQARATEKQLGRCWMHSTPC